MRQLAWSADWVSMAKYDGQLTLQLNFGFLRIGPANEGELLIIVEVEALVIIFLIEENSANFHPCASIIRYCVQLLQSMHNNLGPISL